MHTKAKLTHLDHVNVEKETDISVKEFIGLRMTRRDRHIDVQFTQIINAQRLVDLVA